MFGLFQSKPREHILYTWLLEERKVPFKEKQQACCQRRWPLQSCAKGGRKCLKKKDMNMSASFNIADTMMIWWQILLGGVDAEQTIRPDLLLHTKAMIQVWAIMTFENVAQGFSPPKSLLTRHYWRSLSGPRKWHQKSIFQQAANHL